MTRRPKPIPFTTEDLVTGELRRAPRARRWLTTTVVIVLCVLVAVVAYAVTFAPDHYATWRAERLSKGDTVAVSDGVTVTPGAGWVAQPRVTNLVEWPPLPPLRDWAVLTGAETGVNIVSPDHGLSIELSVRQDSEQRVDAWLGDIERADDSETATGHVRIETLASGAELQHIDDVGELRAVVTLGETQVQVLARTAEPESAEASSPTIDDYRPALSVLLESLTVG